MRIWCTTAPSACLLQRLWVQLRKAAKEGKIVTAQDAVNAKLADALKYDDEVKDEIKAKGKIYYNKLRYWKNGTLITGIWALLKNDLFYYLGDTESEAERNFSKVSKNMKYSDSKDSFIYFYQGIFMKSALDYTTCMTTSINFDLLQLSYVSRYPIINLKLKVLLHF